MSEPLKLIGVIPTVRARVRLREGATSCIENRVSSEKTFRQLGKMPMVL